MDLIPASEFSLQQLADVYNEARSDYLVPMPMTPAHLGRYIAVYDVDLAASAVATRGAAALGLCLLGLRGERAWITRLGVVPRARRAGCARALLARCLDSARERGARLVQLEVIADNVPAQRLFQASGFSPRRRLLVMRRRAGLPLPLQPVPPPAPRWLDTPAALSRAAARTGTPAWTNETASLANAGGVAALCPREPDPGAWVTYQHTPAGLERVVVAPEEAAAQPVYELLYHLHARYPADAATAENLPADAPCVGAFRALGYTLAFERVEMTLTLPM